MLVSVNSVSYNVHYMNILLVQRKGILAANSWRLVMIQKKEKIASFSENDNIFLEGLKSDNCRSVLANRFKNIQGNWGELWNLKVKLLVFLLKLKI